MKMFIRKHLEVMYRTQLYKIAKDLDLDITKKTKKGELIERLLEHEVIPMVTVSVEEEPPQMSVQVRRIYESSKGERL